MLTDDQLEQFGRDGYIVVRQAVPEDLLAAVDVEIDAAVASDPPPADTRGQHFYFLTPDRLPAADAALRESGAWRTAEELVAPHRLDHALDHIQIALNIPVFPHRPGGPHIDGHRPEQAEPRSFTLLAAVYLVDESEPDAGNLWVWPGSHLVHQRLFAERGVGALLPVSGQPTLLHPGVTFAEPTAVFARRGDLLLAHFLLGHNIGGNITDVVRRIVYYRLSADGHAARWSETFLDVFTEYEPVRRLLRSER